MYVYDPDPGYNHVIFIEAVVLAKPRLSHIFKSASVSLRIVSSFLWRYLRHACLLSMRESIAC